MKYTIRQFQKEFPNDDVCLDYIFQKRFGHISDFKKYYRVTGRKCYAHSETGEQIHPTACTIFHKSSTPLTLWLFAIFLFSQSKNGVSAKELERQLGVTYKCAYRIGQQIRKLMNDKVDIFTGTTEEDETYIGGKGGNNKRGRGAEKKTAVFGMVERGGEVVAKAVENVKTKTILPILRSQLQQGAGLMTDEYNIYNQTRYFFNHQVINHGAKQYVSGNVHTNSIEGFWSQLKNSIRGTYKFVSKKHLQSYINEFAWRYNHRKSEAHPFTHLVAKI